VTAAGEFCDVVSFNIYRSRVDPRDWDFVNSIDKPCIIGEFHFGAVDRGMFHTGLVAAADQKARAQMYRDYIHSVVDHPAFIGCGWFQYFDEPLTGRTYDGENYNIGLLDVTDTPYPEMIEAARLVHAEAYGRRYGSRVE
jgi:agarase